MSEEDAWNRLAALCASAEHCQHEMVEKLRKWEIADDAQARIMERLVSERYVDDERYARAFVRDKLRYNKWGRRKIEQALWAKGIDEDTRRLALDDISDEEYLSVLRPLIKGKRNSTRASNQYELNAKLIRYALGRGFGMALIRQCLDGDYDEEGYEED